MSLKDLIMAVVKGTNGVSIPQEDEKSKDATAILTADSFPMIADSQFDISKYRKVPLTEIAALGTAFSSLPAAARTITQSQTFNQGNGEKLFVRILRKPMEGFMQMAKDGLGETGNEMVLNKQGKNVIRQRARYREVATRMQSTTSTVLPFNPTMMFIAIALMNIEKKLVAIQETQRDILAFLEDAEKAKQRGNLNTLNEILNNYKFNCNNEMYKTNKHILVQEIKRDAEQGIILYQEQIARKLGKQEFIHASQNAEGMLTSTISEFREYQLALYLFAFASYLEIMLLENFDAGYLANTIKKTEAYASRYQEIYEGCQRQIEGYLKSSLDKQLLIGLAGISKAVGAAIAKVPIIGQSQIDETLVAAGEQMGKMHGSGIEQSMQRLGVLQDSRIQPFVENINAINLLYNQPMSMLMDQESVYILN